jgi:hypothetical protein
MKRLVIVLLLFVILTPLSVMGISEENSSDFYYVKVHLERIYPSENGYVVLYRKGVASIGTIGIPTEWFSGIAGKAEIVNLPRGADWPYMTLFYKNGEFSHVRLYVHTYKGHRTWGNVPQFADVSKYFSGQDSLKLEFE